MNFKYSQAFLLFAAFAALSSCRTTKDMERFQAKQNEPELEAGEAKSQEEVEQANEEELRKFFVTEEAKIQDVEDTVVFVDRPVYVPQEERDKAFERGNKTGIDAVAESQKRATMEPELYNKGTFYYQFNENLVYEVYAQPYHLTDIILEKGEIVTGTPLLSEDEAVWAFHH